MKAQVRPAHEQDLNSIIELLHHNLDSRLSLEQWRHLFQYPDVRKQPNLGFVLVSQGELVGFLGAIYSERHLRGRIERFCNLTSWCVLPEFRASSISLLLELLSQPGYTFINLAPSEAVGELMLRCGFQPLECHKMVYCSKVYRTFLESRRRLASGGRLKRAARAIEGIIEPLLLRSTKLYYEGSHTPPDNRVQLILGADLIRPRLSDVDQRLLDDHRHCSHFLLCCDTHYSYIVAVNRKLYFGRHYLTGDVVSDLLHISDVQLALQYWRPLCWRIVGHLHSHAVMADERLFASYVPEGFRISCRSYFKSRSGLMPHQIDGLYTEVPFLDVLIYA